ncbi:MAG: hypothetical protein IK016_10325 [Lachnospiraceae bacterium]|nr:hypothetical protein [Lachnospiraceae bacterium]
MTNVFKTVLLVALPASGKSEVRNFMAQMDAARLKEEFHIGENLQLDDFPYVHMMRQIDLALGKKEYAPQYYASIEKPFLQDYDWGTLIHLLNEDYANLKNRVRVQPASYAMHLFERIDRASVAAGLPPRMSMLPAEMRVFCAQELEAEAAKMRADFEAQYTEDFRDKTIVIECARGGTDGAPMPLKGAFGYQYTLPQFSPEILNEAVVLYLWVTPEESRRKNNERANPDDPGSNLFHGVPMEVMLHDYGCDDMTWLREKAEQPDTLTVKAHGNTWHLPVGVIDNRVDKTSFLRADKAEWEAEKVADITAAIKGATDTLWNVWNKGE